MIKAKLRNGDLIFGLSDENIKRLTHGEPIKIRLKEMGLEDRDILIVHGATEAKIYKDMLPHFDSNTKIYGTLPR